MILNVYRVHYLGLRKIGNKDEAHLGDRPTGVSQYIKVAAVTQEEAVEFSKKTLGPEEHIHVHSVFTIATDVWLGEKISGDVNLTSENETLKATLAATQQERANVVRELTAEIEQLKAKENP